MVSDLETMVSSLDVDALYVPHKVPKDEVDYRIDIPLANIPVQLIRIGLIAWTQ